MSTDPVTVVATDPADPAAQRCLAAYFAELDRRFDAGFDPALSIAADDDDMRPPAGLLLVASLRSAGYVEVAPFNDETYAHHWFEKALVVPS